MGRHCLSLGVQCPHLQQPKKLDAASHSRHLYWEEASSDAWLHKVSAAVRESIEQPGLGAAGKERLRAERPSHRGPGSPRCSDCKVIKGCSAWREQDCLRQQHIDQAEQLSRGRAAQ